MIKFSKWFLSCVLSLGFATIAIAADEKGNADQAQAMTKKAVAHFKSVGKEKAFADFSDPANKQFHDRDLYVMAYDLTGNNMAHGANSKLIGKNLLEIKDADDKFIIKEMIKTATTGKGSGWVEYKWPNPVTKALEPKSTYVEKVDTYFIGVGIYK
jgi:hypothetical protein